MTQLHNATARVLPGQLSDLDVRLLRVFRAIVECGGMSAAELELNISRSAISRHLKDLEIRLGGLVLCRRGRAGFALTTEGEQVYAAALELQAAMDAFRMKVNQLQQRITGNLAIAIGDKTATNPKARLAEAMRSFTDRAPDVKLEAHVHPLNLIEPRVIDGTYEVGIIPMHRRSSSLEYYPLFSEKMYLYCAPSHPLCDADHASMHWDDVCRYDYVGLGYHSPNMELGQRVKLKPKATAFDQEAVLTLIESGCYIGFLPGHYAESFVRSNCIRRIENERFQYEVQYSGVTGRTPAPSRSVRIMLECLLRVHHDAAPKHARPH